MIWWPFNRYLMFKLIFKKAVTHQWSGDLSIEKDVDTGENKVAVTHQWSGDLSIQHDR